VIDRSPTIDTGGIHLFAVKANDPLANSNLTLSLFRTLEEVNPSPFLADKRNTKARTWKAQNPDCTRLFLYHEHPRSVRSYGHYFCTEYS
jgi:hypothetical protein